MPDRLAGDVRLGDLAHGDRGLHPGVDSLLLQEVLQRKAVQHGAEHAHVVGAAAVHAPLGQFRPPQEVAAADHDGDLDAFLGHPGDLPGEVADHVRVDAELTVAEDLTRELQQHPPVGRAGDRGL